MTIGIHVHLKIHQSSRITAPKSRSSLVITAAFWFVHFVGNFSEFKIRLISLLKAHTLFEIADLPSETPYGYTPVLFIMKWSLNTFTGILALLQR